MLNYGIDMTARDNPYEVGLGWLVDKEKQADFIGKQALTKVRAEGVQRKLVGLEIEGDRIPFNMVRWPVRQHDEQIGSVTSAIYSPRLKKNLAYAMVPVAAATLDTTLMVEIPDAGAPAGTERVGERIAKVVPKPFIDPEKDIPKA
jgi:aminomethyltransferase